MQDEIDDFLKSQVGNGEDAKIEKIDKPTEVTNPEDSPWDKIILPKCTYMVTGDVGTGKSALCHWILERYSKKYGLTPCVVGFPENKMELIPGDYRIISSVEDVVNQEDSIVFVDEAGLQLPLDDTRVRDKVTNFLAQYRQRRQILILCYHIPRLVLVRYLSFFAGFLLKRPPYLIEFASKTKTDTLAQMMYKAEERFGELVPPDWKPNKDEMQPIEVKKHTYVVAPRIRWQGVLENPTPSYWKESLSEVWAGTKIDPEIDGVVQTEMSTSGLMDVNGKIPITDRMLARAIVYKEAENGGKKTYLDPSTNTYWEA